MSSGLPAVVDLTAYQGDTWTQVFRLGTTNGPTDLTGATIAAWAAPPSGTPLVLEATVLDAPAGLVQLAVGDDGLPAGLYTYDVEITQDAVVTTWMRGTLRVQADVTHG